MHLTNIEDLILLDVTLDIVYEYGRRVLFAIAKPTD